MNTLFRFAQYSPRLWRMVALGLLLSQALLMGATPSARAGSAVTVAVQATVETEALPGNADDPAIWIHPDDPAQSLIIGTYKNKGIRVFDVAGNLLQFVSEDFGMNNVDLRYHFPLGGERVALVTATNRDTNRNTVAMYKVNAVTRQLENVTTDPPLQVGIGEVYGTCMYHSPFSGKYYVFVNGVAGDVEQWELFDNGSGRVTGTLVRSFSVGSITEGCVADDVLGHFYIGEETAGLWKYGAEPGAGTTRTQVDTTGAGGHLTSNVEGVSLYYTAQNTGYLVVSSQGSDEYVIYTREGNNDYVMTFAIVAGGVDATSETDGLDVTNFPLGPAFPQGVLVVHDNVNDDGSGPNNFKLVPWEAIANAVVPPLVIDTTWDPRQIGAPETVQFSNSIYSVLESSGVAPLTVSLSASSEFTVTVNYATGDGSATAGSDYTPISGTLSFSPGQTSRPLNVPILADALAEPNETVLVALTEPLNATLGAPSSATVFIVEGNHALYLPFLQSSP